MRSPHTKKCNINDRRQTQDWTLPSTRVGDPVPYDSRAFALYCCSFTLKIIVRLSRIFWFIQRTLSYNFGTHLVARCRYNKKYNVHRQRVFQKTMHWVLFTLNVGARYFFQFFVHYFGQKNNFYRMGRGSENACEKQFYRNFAEKCGTIHSLIILIVLLRRKTPISE